MSEGDEIENAPVTESPAAVAPYRATSASRAGAAPLPTPTMLQWMFLVVVTLAVAGGDLWSKSWAARTLSEPAYGSVPLCVAPAGLEHYRYQRDPVHDVVLVPNFLALRYAENCGGAFGLFNGQPESRRKPFFLLMSIAAVVFIVQMYRRLEPGQGVMRWALPLVLGGAIGNLADRIRLGYVVDFVDAHWKAAYHWPTFNVADVGITVGILLMLLEYIIGPAKARTPPAAKPAAA